MNVVITGGAGFLGTRLAGQLLQRGTLQDGDSRERPSIGSCSSTSCRHQPSPTAASSPSPATSRIPICWRAHRRRAPRRFSTWRPSSAGWRKRISSSACASTSTRRGCCSTSVAAAVTVPGWSSPVQWLSTEGTCRRSWGMRPRVSPRSSYGTQKAVAELLISDWTRRGFVDGRVLRLPTISVRPGRPNAAASSFASGIIREPLKGEEAVCPVAADTRLWLMSPTTAIECLITGHELAAGALGDEPDRQPAGNLGHRRRDGGRARARRRIGSGGRIRWERDDRIERIVASWPGACDITRALVARISGRRELSGDYPHLHERMNWAVVSGLADLTWTNSVEVTVRPDEDRPTGNCHRRQRRPIEPARRQQPELRDLER